MEQFTTKVTKEEIINVFDKRIFLKEEFRATFGLKRLEYDINKNMYHITVVKYGIKHQFECPSMENTINFYNRI